MNIKEAYGFGIAAAYDAILAEKGLEKTAEDNEVLQAKLAAVEKIEEIKIASRYQAIEDAINFLKSAGMTKAAEALEEAANNEIDQAAAAADTDDEEVLVGAAIAGAAQEIAEQTGKDPEDPEVQEAAVQVVDQALQEQAAAAGAE